MRRRGRGTGSVYYDASKGKYVAQLELSPLGGRRRYKREYFDTKTAAKERLKEWLDVQGTLREGYGPTLWAYLESWMGSRHFKTLAATTRIQYAQLLTDYVQRQLGDVPIRKLTPRVLSEWLDGLIPDGEKARRTVGLVRDVLRSALGRAVETDELERNPLEELTLHHKEPREIRVLTTQEVAALLDAALPWLRTLLAVMVLLGLRRGEILGLQWDDLKWEGTLTIQRSIVAKVHRKGRKPGPGVKAPKTKAGTRTIPLPSLVLEFLAAHRRRLELECAMRRRQVPVWIFPSERGGFISPRNLNRAYYATRTAAGLDTTIRLHDLRHTAATALLTLGVDETAVAKWLGHRDARTTRSIYHHPERSVQQAGATALTRHWRTAMTSDSGQAESPNDSMRTTEKVTTPAATIRSTKTEA